jgi:hypothetical protein
MRVMVVPLGQILRSFDSALGRQTKQLLPFDSLGLVAWSGLDRYAKRRVDRNLDAFIGSHHLPVEVAVELDHADNRAR